MSIVSKSDFAINTSRSCNCASDTWCKGVSAAVSRHGFASSLGWTVRYLHIGSWHFGKPP